MKLLICLIFALSTLNLFADTTIPDTKLIKESTLYTQAMKEQNPNIPVCQFARKDYDSPGFGITYREGFHIKGKFGCMYYCSCNGKPYYVTHVYENEYFDSAIWTNDTGGPKRAKWFICPHSVDEDSWRPMRDELERIIGYQVDEDRSFFEPRQTTIKEINQWANTTCRKR